MDNIKGCNGCKHLTKNGSCTVQGMLLDCLNKGECCRYENEVTKDEEIRLKAHTQAIKEVLEIIDNFEEGTEYTGIFTEKKVKQIVKDRFEELKAKIGSAK